MGRNRPGWALGPRKRHSPSCLFKTQPPNWRTESKSRWSPSLFYKRLANFLVLFFHWDSGSSLPAWLLWVAEHIMAPCIQATALKMQPWMQLCTAVLFKMAIHFKKSWYPSVDQCVGKLGYIQVNGGRTCHPKMCLWHRVSLLCLIQ